MSVCGRRLLSVSARRDKENEHSSFQVGDHLSLLKCIQTQIFPEEVYRVYGDLIVYY
jgi:hypothetical protein